jgi:cell division septation protein DedD
LDFAESASTDAEGPKVIPSASAPGNSSRVTSSKSSLSGAEDQEVPPEPKVITQTPKDPKAPKDVLVAKADLGASALPSKEPAPTSTGKDAEPKAPSPTKTTSVPSLDAQGRAYVVVMHHEYTLEEAQKVLAHLKSFKPEGDLFIVEGKARDGKPVHRVVLGYFATEESARSIAGPLAEKAGTPKDYWSYSVAIDEVKQGGGTLHGTSGS